MQLSEKELGGVHILLIEGRFDAHTSTPATEWLEEKSASTGARIVINFSKTEFIDSVALASLVSAMKRCRQTDGDVVLCELSKPVKIIFELTRLNRAFQIYETEVDAMVGYGI